MAQRFALTAEYVAARLLYNSETGRLYWRSRPREMFLRERDWRAFNHRYAGKRAFTAISSSGYRVGGLAGRMHYAHRVIWLLAHGTEPDIVDHIDGDVSNNHLSNLRSGTSSENLRNMRQHVRCRSGVTGVYWNKPARKWLAQMRVKEFSRSKSFDSLAEAIAWRKKLQRELGFSERHGASRADRQLIAA